MTKEGCVRNDDCLSLRGALATKQSKIDCHAYARNDKREEIATLTLAMTNTKHMSLEEIKNFLSVQSSFVAHAKHANSYELIKKTKEK